jgi:hypothetical protein
MVLEHLKHPAEDRETEAAVLRYFGEELAATARDSAASPGVAVAVHAVAADERVAGRHTDRAVRAGV